MKNPGRMKTRLVIEAPVESDDGQGGVLRSHGPVATVWAAVMPERVQHGGEADSDGAVVKLRIVLRSGLALTLRTGWWMASGSIASRGSATARIAASPRSMPSIG